MNMIANKPYLLRAFYEWIVDSHCTPLVVIDSDYLDLSCVPEECIEDGEITLNISPSAVKDLKLGNESIEFYASFLGEVHFISVSIKGVLGAYAEETKQGIFFDYEMENALIETIPATILGADPLPPFCESDPEQPRVFTKPNLKFVE